MNRIGEIALATVLVLGAVGCSSGAPVDGAKKDDRVTSTTIPAEPPSSSGTDDSAPVSPPDTGQIDRSPVGGVGVIKTTDMTSCDTEPGEVEASGTVSLPDGMEPGTVSISVSWVNAETGTVFARSRVDVGDVDSSAPKDWKVENTLPDNGVTVRCVVGASVIDE